MVYALEVKTIPWIFMVLPLEMDSEEIYFT